MTRPMPTSVDDTLDLLNAGDYVGDRALATSLFLALKLGRPLFLEGEAGVGKTEIAKVLAATLGRKLVRLQCYEGAGRGLRRLRVELPPPDAGDPHGGGLGATGNRDALSSDIFGEEFLIRRPLLQALEPDVAGPPVLLIDELDRTDEPFEAYLLEVLSDFQISIPEIGTIKADKPPIVIITSNRTREIHDALKRRCFYHWVDYPDAERERRIIEVKAPGVKAELSRQIVGFVQRLRDTDLFKVPGVAETLDWTQALAQLDVLELDPGVINDTLGTLLKYQDDIEKIRGSEASRLLAEIHQERARAASV